ncbi:site-specific integrase, partial [Dehalococcoidia bacterium]|nr:site-specific integrase [Dehalococcoidia bacterium]
FGLGWHNVDLPNSSVHITATLLADGTLASPKTLKGRRHITLTAIAVAALERRKKIQIAERLATGSTWDNTRDLVFTNLRGNHLHHSNFNRRDFRTLLTRAGVRRVRFHDLRHSTASLLLSLGAHPKVVQELLGHSQISVTMDIYSHVLPSLQEDAMQRLNQLLAESGTG